MLTLLPLLLVSQALTPEPIKASTLKAIIGPAAPRYPDPASGLGSDRTMLKLRRSARRGSIMAVEIPAGTSLVSDQIMDPSGWKAYLVRVPGKASVTFTLHADHEAWFRLTTANRWGRMEEGMLQNRIYKGRPVASYQNPKDSENEVFFIVDTTSADPASDAYTLEIAWK